MISSPKLRSPSKSQMAKRREIHKVVAAQALSSRVNKWAEVAREGGIPVSERLDIQIQMLKGELTVQQAYEDLEGAIAYHRVMNEWNAKREADNERAKAERLKELEDIATKEPTVKWWPTKLRVFPMRDRKGWIDV